MLSVGHILEALQGNTVCAQIKITKDAQTDHIAFFMQNARFAKESLLIMQSDALAHIQDSNCIEEGATILVANGYKGLLVPDAPSVNIIVTDLDTMELFNRFSSILAENLRWKTTLLETMLTHNDIQSILHYGGTCLGASAMLISKDGRPLGAYHPDMRKDAFVELVLDRGSFDFEDLNELVNSPYWGMDRLHVKRYYSRETDHFYYLMPIDLDNVPTETLLLSTDSKCGKDTETMAKLMCRCIKEVLCQRQIRSKYVNDELLSLFRRIMAETVSAQEVKQRLNLVPWPIKDFCAIGIIEFEERLVGEIPYGLVMNQLSKIMEQCNMFVYDSSIVILITYPQRNLNFQYDCDKLNALMHEHRAYFAVSNATRNRAMLRTLYIQTKDTIQLAKTINIDKSNRVFLNEDYSMYNIIHYCAQQFKDVHHHNDIIYLIHPSVVEIARFDKNNNNNLLEVLYCYLVNDRNLVKTAKSLYMHRNTVLNKINRITEIIGRDLDNGEFQQRIMFSCQLMQYYQRYMESDISLN